MQSFCAFAASDCASMWRWDDYAPEPWKSKCVDPVILQQRDAGADGAQSDAQRD